MTKKDDKIARALIKARNFFFAYNATPLIWSELVERAKRAGTDAHTELMNEMKQQWIIEGEWSEYHKLIAHSQGWGLLHVRGMWQIVSLNSEKFKTDEDARLFVLDHEHDRDSSLFAYAVHAIIVGNMR